MHAFKNIAGVKRFIGSAFLLLAISTFIIGIIDLSFPMETSPPWSKVVYDRNGKVLHVYLSVDDKWRIRCQPAAVDSLFIQTLLKKEDQYFYYHPGINPIAIARAAFNNLIKGQRTSGASTITMQVVRLLEPRPRTFFSKITEAFRALQLELHHSKDEILSLYLSLAPYGGNIEGVVAASHLYFGKAPSLLSPAEAVTLSIIPNRPSSLRPGKGNALLFKERNRWLKKLYHEHLIPLSDLEEALNEPLEMHRGTFSFLAPHLSRRLTAGNKQFEIRSSIDADLQEKVSQLCYNHVKRLQNIGIGNGAIIVIDNKSHEVLAYAGSQDFYDNLHSGQVDGIVAIRSPGSTLKPLVYALAFDKGIITPKSILEDVAVNYDGYRPENFDLHFHGGVSAEDALSSSLNVPAVLLLEKTGVASFRASLLAAGCSSMKEQQQLGLSTILGGCGIMLEELSALYTAFANDGTYSPLRYTTGDTSRAEAVQVISPSSAFLLSSILTKMNRSDLPQLFENSLHIPKVAWKTGTSYGRRDAWSIGYNQRYTVGVWVGNFDGKGVPELTGADMATPLLFQVFNSIDYNSTGKWFRPPAALDLRYVCPKSGNLPGDLCTEKVIDYFLPGISSMATCTHLAEFKTDPSEKISYCTACMPENGYKKKIYENPPPDLLKFYRENSIPLQLAPPHNPACSRLFEGSKPQILSLAEGQEYLIEKEDPRSLELSCAVAADVNTVSWFIDDIFYRTAKADEKLFFVPGAGRVKISCSDDKGRNRDISIQVVYY